jgi:hypothetical protein
MREDARPDRWLDLAVVLVYLAAALLVLGGLWAHPSAVNPAANDSDPPFFEWALIHASRIFTHGENPFATARLNAPLGVNLMANTGLLGLTIPLVPVTLALGPPVAYVLLTTLALAGTAAAWYFVLSRHVVDSQLAAAVGGGFAGFAPGLVNHTNGHPNLVAQFLIPFIVWRALALRTAGDRPGRAWIREGVLLGLLVTWQAFVNEELLFLAALAAGVFVAVYAAFRPAEVAAAVRPFLRGALVAALVAGALLAYPLWYQFAGPQHYHGLPGFVLGYGADLASYPAFAKLSLIGQPVADANLAPNPEENTFFGWPLLVALAVVVVWLWPRVAVRALAAVGLVFFVLSLGTVVNLRGHEVFKPAPWGWLDKLPLFDSVVPVRLGLVLIPVIAVLLAIAVDAVGAQRSAVVRVAGLVALGLALVPLVPRQVPVHPRPPVPAFIASGDWRRYLTGDRSLLSADTTWNGNIDAMVWDNAARHGYRMVGGYFLGPDGDGRGSFGPMTRPTAALLAGVGYDGGAPSIGDEQRAAAAEDVRFWGAGLVVLADGAPHADELHAALDGLFGAGRRVDDVWLWDVSSVG